MVAYALVTPYEVYDFLATGKYFSKTENPWFRFWQVQRKHMLDKDD